MQTWSIFLETIQGEWADTVRNEITQVGLPALGFYMSLAWVLGWELSRRGLASIEFVGRRNRTQEQSDDQGCSE